MGLKAALNEWELEHLEQSWSRDIHRGWLEEDWRRVMRNGHELSLEKPSMVIPSNGRWGDRLRCEVSWAVWHQNH